MSEMTLFDLDKWCDCDEDPRPHFHCSWSGDADWHCPKASHIHLKPAAKRG